MSEFKCIATDKILIKDLVEELPDGQLKEKCLELKNKQGDTEYVRKYFTSDGVKAPNLDSSTVLNYITMETLDRDGEVVKVKGIRKDNFMQAVFWAHDYKSLPVAKNLWLKSDKNGILAATKFLDKTEFQQGVKAMYTEDIEGTGPTLKTFSIGFLPLKAHLPTEAEKKKYGEGTKMVYDEVELLEYSAVGIPANRDALTVAVGKGVDLLAQKDLPEVLVKIIDDAVAVPAEELEKDYVEVDESEKEVKDIEQDIEAKDAAVDVDGNPSIDAIIKAINFALNPPTAALEDNRVYMHVKDVFPKNYPHGSVVVGAYNDMGSIPKYWTYDYIYNAGNATLANPVLVEEFYRPVSGIIRDEGKENTIRITSKSENSKKEFTNDEKYTIIKIISDTVSDAVTDSLKEVKTLKKDLKVIADESIRKAMGKVS